MQQNNKVNCNNNIYSNLENEEAGEFEIRNDNEAIENNIFELENDNLFGETSDNDLGLDEPIEEQIVMFQSIPPPPPPRENNFLSSKSSPPPPPPPSPRNAQTILNVSVAAPITGLKRKNDGTAANEKGITSTELFKKLMLKNK